MLRGKKYFTAMLVVLFHLLMTNVDMAPSELCYDLTFIFLSVEHRDRFPSIELSLLPRQKENTTFILVTTACYYQFTNPKVPSVKIPAAQPYSPGDISLTPNNAIQLSSGVSLSQGCNSMSGTFYYKNSDGTYSNTCVDSSGKSVTIQPDIFYATGSDLRARTIQSNNPDLGN